MSVLATLDFANGDWTFKVEPETPSPDFEIGFKNNGGPVERFSELSFGFAVAANGVTVTEKSYPPENVKYVASDQTYLTNDRIHLNADNEVVFSVWAKNGGQRYEGQTTFTVPRPAQPYSSWVWNGLNWEAPVSYPEDGGQYEWDESAQNWATVDPISEQGDT